MARIVTSETAKAVFEGIEHGGAGETCRLGLLEHVNGATL